MQGVVALYVFMYICWYVPLFIELADPDRNCPVFGYANLISAGIAYLTPNPKWNLLVQPIPTGKKNPVRFKKSG